MEGPWASQSTVLYIIHTVLPYPTFSGGTEKERIGGQTPLGEQESYCTAKRKQRCWLGCQCRIWESQIHIQALLPALWET